MSQDPLPQTWLSVHLYYNEPWETFLHEAIQPYLRTAINTGVADQYYFERNWERGPHIRLHFRGDAILLESILKENLIEHFENYFESKPSQRVEPIYAPGYPDNQKWQPNHSIHFVQYRSNLDCWPNELLQNLVAAQFMASSDASLSYIASGNIYNELLKNAIRLHITFAYAMGINLDTMKHFFTFILKSYLATDSNINQIESAIPAPSKRNTTLKVFGKTFEKHKAELIPLINSILQTLVNGTLSRESILNKWIIANRKTGNEIVFAATQRQIRFDESGILLNSFQKFVPIEQLRYWPLFKEMISMTNNRLGILLKDEASLAFMIRQSLFELENQMAEQKEIT